MSVDPLGDRMKGYENAFRATLPLRMPVIVRVDGKAFHSYTRTLMRPWDDLFSRAMDAVAVKLCAEMQGAALAFVQSDEISVLLHNYKTLQTQAWLSNGLQKIASVAASIASATMTAWSPEIFDEIRPAYFDGRVFVLPEAEVCNYFLWRRSELQELAWQKGMNWDALPVERKRGRCAMKVPSDGFPDRPQWGIDRKIPIFSQDRSIEKHLATEPKE